MEDIKVKYSELQIGDIIYWYGALVRIISINRVNTDKGSCTYFEIEPYNDESIKILGKFYAHGSYGGVDWLEVHKVINEGDITPLIN